MWRHVEETVNRMRGWADYSARQSLRGLGVGPRSYCRWRQRAVSLAAAPALGAGGAVRPPAPHAVLPGEEQAVVEYALKHPNPRHRELAWRSCRRARCTAF
jgi:hypothetical protein